MITFLIGFMAAGKTSVGSQLAAAEGRELVDLDAAIAAEQGVAVAELVKRDEAAFRVMETAKLGELIASGRDLVVATGGGAAAHGDNVECMRAAGLVIALGVDGDEAARRVARDAATERPLFDVQRLRDRLPFYRRAHAMIDTTRATVAEVVAQIQHVERTVTAYPSSAGRTIVALGERSYPIVVEDSVLDADLFRAALPTATKIAIVTDMNVAAHWLEAARRALPTAEVVVVPPGEGSKSFATYESLCAELIARGLDRGSAIVALGGGVVGDLAGFVAATLFRGIPVIQVPTTLVAMTDAAIGGKTAVDLWAGKNLVGAFWQPRLVACGLETLATLPPREKRAGFGELWKYALLDGPAMWKAVAGCAAWAASDTGDVPPAMRDVITRAVAYKAAVVSADELERTGVRALLNLGHTIGHTIETASGQTDAPLLHGECVGLGLIAACRVSASVGGKSLETEVTEALRSSGLPTDVDRWLTDDVLDRLSVDKKRTGSSLKFIVIREVGACEPIAIPVTDVRRILRSNLTP